MQIPLLSSPYARVIFSITSTSDKTPSDNVTIFVFNCHPYFKELKRRVIDCYIYQIVTILFLFLCSEDASFLLILFPHCLKNFLKQFFQSRCAHMNSLTFSSCENAFCPEGCYPGYRILTVLFFQT